MSHEPGLHSAEVDPTGSLYGELVEWLTVHGERAGDALVYSSAYLAVIAMVQAAIVMVLLSLPASPAPVVVGLVTFAVYANDRLVDVDTDVLTDPNQAAFVRRNGDVLYVLAAIAYGLAVALAVLGGPVALAITLLPGVFWVLYATEWIPTVGLNVRRLKEPLLVNSVLVALGWAVVLTLLPMTFGETAITPAVAFVFAYYFLGTFANTEIPNVYDVDADKAVGVNTLPIAFGVDRTRQVLYVIDLFLVAIVGSAVITGHLVAWLAAPLLVGLVYSFSITGLLGRFENGRLLTIAAESEYVFVGLVLAAIVFVA